MYLRPLPRQLAPPLKKRDSRRSKSKTISEEVAPLPVTSPGEPDPHGLKSPAPIIAGAYTQLVAAYESLHAATEDLGCNARCVGHCARVVNTLNGVTFLRCNLRDSEPKCAWYAIICSHADGATLYQHANDGVCHNSLSKCRGSLGCKLFHERRKPTKKPALGKVYPSQCTTKDTVLTKIPKSSSTKARSRKRSLLSQMECGLPMKRRHGVQTRSSKKHKQRNTRCMASRFLHGAVT